MVKKIIDHWQIILKVFGGIVATSGVIGVLWGVFRFVDNTNNTNDATKELIVKFDSLDRKFDKGFNLIINDLGKLKTDNTETRRALSNLQRSYLQYITNDDRVTKQDLVKFMEGLDVKKNMSNDMWILSNPK